MADLTADRRRRSPGRARSPRPGSGPADVAARQLYDAFTITPILFLEDLGFCAKGEGGAFVADGRIDPGGALPVNTNGGGLSYCHPGMYGLLAIVEAVARAVREAGDGRRRWRTATAASCRARPRSCSAPRRRPSASSRLAAMDFELTDEQRLDPADGARVHRQRDRPGRRRELARTTTSTPSSSRRSPPRATSARSSRASTAAPGLDYITYALICEEIGRGCSAMRTVISVQTSLVCSTILAWGTEEQKQKYLPQLCSGEWLGLLRPDRARHRLRRRQPEDARGQAGRRRWLINGAKMWISLGNHARLALVFAQTDPALGHKGLACFLVETDQPGWVQPQEIKGKMGLWASDTAQIGARRRRRRARTRCSAASATASRSR